MEGTEGESRDASEKSHELDEKSEYDEGFGLGDKDEEGRRTRMLKRKNVAAKKLKERRELHKNSMAGVFALYNSTSSPPKPNSPLFSSLRTSCDSRSIGRPWGVLVFG